MSPTETDRLKDALRRALGPDWTWRDDGERIWFRTVENVAVEALRAINSQDGKRPADAYNVACEALEVINQSQQSRRA